MKTISSSLQAFLVGNTTFNRADLISIVLKNSQVINVIYGTNYTQITYPSGLPATLTVLGTSRPWNTTDPTYPFTGTGSTGAISLTMSPGQVVTLSYGSGTITHAGSLACDASGRQGTPSNACPGAYVKNVNAPLGGLIGGFANASGWLISPPFFISNNMTIGPAPVGTTQLLVGVNDSAYTGNTGSWTINIIPPTYYATKYGAWERKAYANEASFKLKASSLDLHGYIPETVICPGTTTPLMQVINQGVFNGAKVIIQSLFWPLGSPPSSGFSMGTMQLMIGQIGNVKPSGRSKIICEVFDLTYVLNREFPPHRIQSACRHSFCDSGCTLQINNFRSTPYALDSSSTQLYLNLTIPARVNSGTYVYGNLLLVTGVLYMCTVPGVAAGSAPSFVATRGATTVDGGVTWTSLGFGSNQSLPLGYIYFVAGQNAGLKRAIKAQTITTGGLAQIQLLKSLPFAVANTDTVQLFLGCDKTLATCELYENLIHFGGMPFVPNPEVSV